MARPPQMQGCGRVPACHIRQLRPLGPVGPLYAPPSAVSSVSQPGLKPVLAVPPSATITCRPRAGARFGRQ